VFPQTTELGLLGFIPRLFLARNSSVEPFYVSQGMSEEPFFLAVRSIQDGFAGK
jgi:hypothetical protein